MVVKKLKPAETRKLLPFKIWVCDKVRDLRCSGVVRLNCVDFPLRGSALKEVCATNHLALLKDAKIFDLPPGWEATSSDCKQQLTPRNHYQIATMADGIDRKADERMEFTTSKDVSVAPTFTDRKFPFLLSTSLLILANSASQGELTPWYLCIWLRVAFCCPISSHRANLQRSRYHRSGAIWYWKDSHLLH